MLAPQVTAPSLRAWTLPAGLAVAFALLTASVALGGFPVTADHALARRLPSGHVSGTARALLDLASVVTTLATPYVAVLLTLLAGCLLARTEGSRQPLTQLIFPLTSLTVCVVGGKALMHRQGPPGSRAAHLLGYYPSGHTTAALVCGGSVAVLALQRRPAWRRRLWVGVLAWTGLVAAALVVHRYHWLSDVVAAALLGSLILVVWLRGLAGTAPMTHSGLGHHVGRPGS